MCLISKLYFESLSRCCVCRMNAEPFTRTATLEGQVERHSLKLEAADQAAFTSLE